MFCFFLLILEQGKLSECVPLAHDPVTNGENWAFAPQEAAYILSKFSFKASPIF